MADIARVPPGVRGFFSRSPDAKPLEPVAVRETNKMMVRVFDQLEKALEPKKDENVQSLLRRVKEARATISE